MHTPHEFIRQTVMHSEILVREAQRSEHFRQALHHYAMWLAEVAGNGPIAETKPGFGHRSGYDHHVDMPADLRLVEQRARLKVDACAFAIERNRFCRTHNRIDEHKARYDAFIARAKELPRCILWMIRVDMLHLSDDALQEALICYSNLADAAALMLSIDASSPTAEERRAGMDLLAEAQSALMVVFSRHNRSNMDQDQFDVWTWVKEQAAQSGMFIEKFMSREHRADPANALDLANRIRAASAQIATKAAATA